MERKARQQVVQGVEIHDGTPFTPNVHRVCFSANKSVLARWEMILISCFTIEVGEAMLDV